MAVQYSASGIAPGNKNPNVHRYRESVGRYELTADSFRYDGHKLQDSLDRVYATSVKRFYACLTPEEMQAVGTIRERIILGEPLPSPGAVFE